MKRASLAAALAAALVTSLVTAGIATAEPAWRTGAALVSPDDRTGFIGQAGGRGESIENANGSPYDTLARLARNDGRGNRATIIQNGNRNTAKIRQRGNNKRATIIQNGDDTDVRVRQRGKRRSNVIVLIW